MKTPEEIAHLKQNWLEDSCWDIETTEGFEDHYAELLAFREEHEKIWEERLQKQLEEKAKSIGCEGNTALASYVMGLEYRLQIMDEKFEKYYERINTRLYNLP